MAKSEKNAQPRGGSLFAKIRRMFTALLRLSPSPHHPKAPGVERISDYLAQDIGMSPGELERLRHQWPSQSSHHPRG